MSLDVVRRCSRCKRMLSTSSFPILRIETDRKGKKHRIYDQYCQVCRPMITPAQRRADVRDIRIPDR